MSPDRIRPGSAGPVGGAPDEEPVAADDPEVDEKLLGDVDGGSLAAGDAPFGFDEGAVEEPAAAVAPARRATPRRRRAVRESPATEPAVEELAPVQAAGTEHRRLFARIYYGETRIDFVRRKRIWFVISSLVILAGVGSLFTRGLNLGIEFVGGTSWTVTSKTLTIQTTQTAIAKTVANADITVLGSNSGGSRQVQVEAKLPKGQGAAEQQLLANKVSAELAAVTHGNVNDISTESVGPSWGGQITQKAVIALIVFFILIAIYISIFFEWRMALAAIVAVSHDVLVTVGIYSLSGFEVTPDTVVAFLTILGYSLYDTIVVFDRIRDNVKNLSVRDRLTFSDVVNLSMNQTLARSINTSLVAIMPILAVLVLGAEFLGATTLQYFGLALLVGLATGAYSSIFIASPLVALMKEREPRYQQLRERLIARGGGRVLLSASQVATGSYGEFATVSPGRARRETTVSGRILAGTAASNGDAQGDGELASNGNESPRTAPRAARPRPAAPPAPRRPTARSKRRGGRR
jgi:preprotein translocase subunit SecF